MVNVWGDCVGAAVVHQCSVRDLAQHQHTEQHTVQHNDAKLQSCDDVIEQAEADPLLTNYRPLNSSAASDWTVRIENETGDKFVISQV